METNNLIQKVNPELVIQESSTKQIVKQKYFFLPVLIAVVVLIIVGIGGYYIYQKRVKPVTISQQASKTIPSLTSTSESTVSKNLTTDNAAPINAGEIGLIEDNKIEILDTSNWQKKELSIPSLKNPVSMNFSRDGNILFISTFNDELIIYNQKKNETVTLPNLKPAPRVKTTDDVSPDGKYFILTQSCCPGDSDKTIMTIDGKIIKVLHGREITWSPNSNAIAISKEDHPLSMGFSPPITNDSIYLEQINEDVVVEKLLVKATNQTSFEPIQWNDNHTILVKKTAYKEPFPDNIDIHDKTIEKHWEDNLNTPTINFIDIDVNTSQQMANTQYSPPPTTDYSSGNYESFISYSPDKKWKVYTQYTSMVAGSRYISKIDGSNKIKISDDAYIVWKPQ